MRVTYDPSVDALYISFRDGGSARIVHPTGDETMAVDFDAEDRIVGIEILDASLRFADFGTLKEVTFEEFGVKQPT